MSPPDKVRLTHMLEAAEKIAAVDLDIIWQIITVDVPPLIDELKRILSSP